MYLYVVYTHGIHTLSTYFGNLFTGEAITFYTEDDAWQLRSIVNVMRAAGCEVPDWMLQLKKERRKSHTKKDNKALGKVGKQSVTAQKAARE